MSIPAEELVGGKHERPPHRKLSYTIAEAVYATGLSKSALYEDISAGKLETRKRGTTTLILAEELARYLAALPKGK